MSTMRPDIRRIRGQNDGAILVEDAHLLNARLPADRGDDPVHRLALIQQHVVAGAAFYRLAELIGAAAQLADELLLMGAQNHIGEDADDEHRHAAHGSDELVADS